MHGTNYEFPFHHHLFMLILQFFEDAMIKKHSIIENLGVEAMVNFFMQDPKKKDDGDRQNHFIK